MVKIQEAEFAEGGATDRRSRADRRRRRKSEGCDRRKADIIFDRDYTLDLGGVKVRFLVGPTHTKAFVEGDAVLLRATW